MHDFSYEHFFEPGMFHTFNVIRNGVSGGQVPGIPNKKDDGRRYFMLQLGSDVQAGDVLIDSATDENYLIEEVKKAAMMGNLAGIDAFYLTDRDIRDREERKAREELQRSQTWSIGTNYGIVGNQANATQTFHFDSKAVVAEIERRGEDVEELKDLVRAVESMQSQGALAKGALSSFSDLMEKHSWISGSIAGAFLGWLQGRLTGAG